jgi:hypothetical protein
MTLSLRGDGMARSRIGGAGVMGNNMMEVEEMVTLIAVIAALVVATGIVWFVMVMI